MWMVNCSEETVYILRKISKSKLRNPPRNLENRNRQQKTYIYLSLLLKKMKKKIKPLKDTAKAAEPDKCTKMDLITVKRTRSGRFVKMPQRYSS